MGWNGEIIKKKIGPHLVLISKLQRTWKKHLNRIIVHTFVIKIDIEKLIEDIKKNICSSDNNNDENVNIVNNDVTCRVRGNKCVIKKPDRLQ